MKISVEGQTEKYLKAGNVSIFDGFSIREHIECLTNQELSELAHYIQSIVLTNETPQFILYLGRVLDEIDRRTGKTALEYVFSEYWGYPGATLGDWRVWQGLGLKYQSAPSPLDLSMRNRWKK